MESNKKREKRKNNRFTSRGGVLIVQCRPAKAVGHPGYVIANSSFETFIGYEIAEVWGHYLGLLYDLTE